MSQLIRNKRIIGGTVGNANEVVYDNTSSVKDKIDEIDSDLSEKGTYTLLADATSTSSTNIVTLNDSLENYKEVVLYYKYGNQYLGENRVAVILVEENTQIIVYMPIGGGSSHDFVRFQKITDTTAYLNTNGSLPDTHAVLYGIK